MGSTVPETLPSRAGRHPRLRREHRQDPLGVPHDSASGRARLRDLADGRVADCRRRERVVRRHVDPRSAMVFAATGSSSFDFYGANRKGDNLFADCVLALDARTGKRVWHFQALQHDVWDLDFPAAPNLVTVTRDGRKIDAVAQVTKTGFVFVLDRQDRHAAVSRSRTARCPASRSTASSSSRTQPVPVQAAAVRAQRTDRGDADAAHAAGARGRARAVPHAEGRPVRAAVARGHDHLSRRRRRRGVGRRGVRSGDGAPLRQLERDAVDRAADREQRHVALQLEVRLVPPDRSHRHRGGADARRHRQAQDARAARRHRPPRHRAGCPAIRTSARRTSTISSTS